MKKTLAVFALLAPLLLGGAAFAQDHSAHHSAEAKPKAEAPKPQAKQKKVKAEKAVLRKVTTEEIGKEAVCPVTGEKHTVKENTGSASYKGKTYYFCCPGCDKSFLATPEKYADKKQAAAAKKVYACPMGDYQGDKPGKCPKCGMKLVEQIVPKTQESAHKNYACPMGDYQGDKPGKCPKCGMKLEEKK